jgi:tetratricopeptide (TPR) repeat protein
VVVAPGLGATGEGPPAATGLPELLEAVRNRGAGTAVSGDLFLQEGELRLQAQMIDVAAEEVIYAIEPVSAPPDRQDDLVHSLQQRVLGMVAVHFGVEQASPASMYAQRILGVPSLWSKLPDYDAYMEYLSGMEVYGNDAEASFNHFQRAASLDPDFVMLLFWVESAYRDRGDWAAAGEILQQIEDRSEALSSFERGRLMYSRALLEGDSIEARRHALQCLALDPENDPLRYVIQNFNLCLNEPGKVVAAFSEWEPTEQLEYGIAPGTWYFRDWAMAYHLLGRYEEELAVVQRALGYYPSFLSMRRQEVRALAALGRVDQIEQCIDESLTVRSGDEPPEEVMLEATLELAVHGHRELARSTAARCVEWLRNRPPQDQRPAALAHALFVAADWQGARAFYEELVHDNPDDIEYLGHLGVTLARLGNEEAARAVADQLRAVDRPYTFGAPAYWQAAITAVLGDPDAAISLIREWIAQALRVDYVALHHDPNFESLRDHPAFRELLRPKG